MSSLQQHLVHWQAPKLSGHGCSLHFARGKATFCTLGFMANANGATNQPDLCSMQRPVTARGVYSGSLLCFLQRRKRRTQPCLRFTPKGKAISPPVIGNWCKVKSVLVPGPMLHDNFTSKCQTCSMLLTTAYQHPACEMHCCSAASYQPVCRFWDTRVRL